MRTHSDDTSKTKVGVVGEDPGAAKERDGAPPAGDYRDAAETPGG